ncbi:sulfotransferase [Paenibacillus sp. YIM B09110]|uniref:sulfotransferase n=1 Tax=Paenibacillus sp. YIM B09110 TaxID=3126102 RepID=UPI00301CBB29
MNVILSAATHRSGSTLVQRILNARPQTLIWGEHLGILRQFHAIQNKMQTFSRKGISSRQAYFQSGENPNQWMALMTPSPEYVEQATIQSVKTFLDHLYQQNKEGHDIIGFKEVRYGAKELTILKKCYPEAKLLLLVRNPLKAWESYPKSWGEYRSTLQFAKQWNNNVNDYLKLVNSDPLAIFVQYEKLIDKDEHTVDQITQLAQISKEQLEAVLAQKIRGSIRKKSITPKQAAIIMRICRRNMKQLGYL